jgi:Uma2 family endonuclease
MATSTLVPLYEYLNTTYEPDCEWLDGQLKERPMGTNSHGTVQTFFIKFFGARERDWNVRVICEVKMQVAARRYRVPDVMIVRRDAPFDEIVVQPPVLVIEVLSRDDRAVDIQEKVEDYLGMGVQAIWIVNPLLRRVFTVQSGGMMPVAELTVPGTPIRILASEVFAELDELEARSR